MVPKPTSGLHLDLSNTAMDDGSSAHGRTNGVNSSAAHSSTRASSSPLRHRQLGRTTASADSPSPNPFGQRRSSFFAESVDEARQSVKSTTDSILLPRAEGPGFNAQHEPSHWHSAPLALALLPAVGGLFFKNGSAIITDITLLALAAVFLNWSVRLPWDWYCSAQAMLLENPDISGDSYPGDTILEEGSEEGSGNEVDDVKGSPASGKSSSRRPIRGQARRGHEQAESELRVHEITALLACFFFPLVGAWLLHAIRSQLSRPSEGLVSNYNLTIFLLASELRPLSHLVKMVQARTIYLQRIVSSNPHSAGEIDKDKFLDVSRRLDELESHIAEKNLASATSGGPNSTNAGQVSTEVRKNIQPELDALNRAVRRYEKRATILTMQTEARLQDIESRMSDAITLAAAAERSHSKSRQSAAIVLLDWACTAIIIPVQAMWSLASFPARVAGRAIGMIEGYIGGKVRQEMKTAGRAGNSHSRAGGSRPPTRGSKKVS